MADEPISALTLFTSYSPADEVEILDVSDTTFASTGTNKRIQFASLLGLAGIPAASSAASGLTGLLKASSGPCRPRRSIQFPPMISARQATARLTTQRRSTLRSRPGSTSGSPQGKPT